MVSREYFDSPDIHFLFCPVYILLPYRQKGIQRHDMLIGCPRQGFLKLFFPFIGIVVKDAVQGRDIAGFDTIFRMNAFQILHAVPTQPPKRPVSDIAVHIYGFQKTLLQCFALIGIDPWHFYRKSVPFPPESDLPPPPGPCRPAERPPAYLCHTGSALPRWFPLRS